MQLAHLVHERIEIGIGVGHLGADLVETLDLRKNVPESHLDVFQDGLLLVERRLLLQDADRVPRGKTGLAVRNAPRDRP